MQATPYQHPSAYDISKRPNQYPCPRTVAEFHALIEEHDRALRHTGSPTHVHNAHTCIKDCKRSLVDYYEINNINQPTRIRRPLTFQSHHALVLSQEVTETLSEPFRRGTNEQLEALAMWRWVLRDTSQTAVLQRLGRFDARRVKEREMEALLSNFATIFFRTTLVDEMRFTFSWREMDDDTLGYCQGPVGIGNPSVIRMDPFKVGDEVDPSTTNKHGLNGRAVERLETVLHELVHAYLQHYSCKSCASYEEYVEQLNGHGGAWQLIAKAVDCATEEYLGFPLSNCRFTAVHANWKSLRRWPTLEEVREWGLVDD